MLLPKTSRPAAIAMWDFSWLERRWPGAGYENPAAALDELIDRGYDAVRIDAYPHLSALDADREWEILPVWTQQMWGSPARTKVRPQPALNDFIEACAERGVRVALSTWFREDVDDVRMRIESPRDLGQAWARTLDGIASAGLLDHILYVDLCNEFPGHIWAPFYSPEAGVDDRVPRKTARARQWMSEAIDVVRESHPGLPYCFSFISQFDEHDDVAPLDLLDLHVFMSSFSDFDDRVGYAYELFEPTGYDNMPRAESIYRADPQRWLSALDTGIDLAAAWSRRAGKPLVTTECWGPINYKDWPLLDWGWVKEVCAYGTRRAAATGSWAAMATSTFCGPQFVGMWRDVEWHRTLTDLIHDSGSASS